MLEREPNAGEVLADAALGALAGAAATAVMTPLTTYLSRHDPEPAKRKEQEVSRRLGAPPPVKVSEKLAGTVGASFPADRRSLAAGVMHYGFGTFWGAVLGAIASRWKPLPPGAGVALGILLWISVDERALPALGLTGKPNEYPRETHARGVAGHIVYGVVLDRTLAVLRSALRR